MNINIPLKDSMSFVKESQGLLGIPMDSSRCFTGLILAIVEIHVYHHLSAIDWILYMTTGL